MSNNYFIEKTLKRFVKKQRVGYSLSLLVSFLITGEVLYSQKMTDKSLKVNEYILKEKIEENNKKIKEIDQKIFELLKEGDYYAKTLEDNKQFFFPINYEHRHSKRGIAMKISAPGMELNKPTITIPGLELNKPGEPGGPITTVPALPILPTKPNINVPDKIVTLKPVKPNLPAKNEGNTNVTHFPMGNIPEPTINDPKISVSTEIPIPTINKNDLEKVEVKVDNVKIEQYIDSPIHSDEKIALTETGFKINSSSIKYGYEPR